MGATTSTCGKKPSANSVDVQEGGRRRRRVGGKTRRKTGGKTKATKPSDIPGFR